ncbi:MAG: endonuclease/exonuclease/phosphatase family protein [Pseudomonadota bacterium]
MRIAAYNVEWFDKLFDDDGALRDDGGWSGRQDVTRGAQMAALAHVFRTIDADAWIIIEAPDDSRRRSTRVALETFAEVHNLRQRAALIGFPNHTQQEIALLYDPDALSARHAPGGPPAFDGEMLIDLDVDDRGDPIRWSKPPLELDLVVGGTPLHLIGVHAKSKAPHGATSPEEIMRLSIANRRKQLAQCIWLRQRVDARLRDEGHLIVAGDFNDGPGLDEYEKLFGRSGVEIVLGDDLYDPHAAQALTNRFAQPTTARFWLPHEGRYLQALLDYIMVSPGLRARRPRWRIWHPFEDAACFRDEALRGALLTASDHFPVSMDLALDP